MVSPFKSSFKHANYKEILLDGDFSPDIGNISIKFFEKRNLVFIIVKC